MRRRRDRKKEEKEAMIAIMSLSETDDDQFGLMDGKIETMDGKIETMDLLSPEVEEVSVFTATKSLRTLGKRSAI